MRIGVLPLLILVWNTLVMPAFSFAEEVSIRQCSIPSILSLIIKPESIPSVVEITFDRSEHVLKTQLPRSLDSFQRKAKTLAYPVVKLFYKKAGKAITVEKTQLMSLIKPNQKYNYVIRDNHLTFIPTGKPFIQEVLSKHVIMENGQKWVNYSGEFWLNEEGVFTFNNASGTFKPSASLSPEVENFFKTNLGLETVVFDKHK